MSDSTPLLPMTRGDHEVAFDRKRGTKYRLLIATLVWALLFSVIVGHLYAAVLRGQLSNSALLLVVFLLLGLLRVVRRWQRKEFDAQKCTVTDRRVVIHSGWLNRSTKFIPLDRIQDVNIHESWLHRMFKITAIEIQTAGSGRPHRPEGFLLAPANAISVRDAIMERRDKLVLGLGGDGGVAPYGIDGNNAGREDNVALSTQVRELKESMMRIEGLLDTGLKRFTTKDQYVVLSVDETSK